MLSPTQEKSPFPGLPKSPRPNQQAFSPNPSLYNGSGSPVTSEKTMPQAFVDRRRRSPSSLIFVDATIPLSPPCSVTSSSHESLDAPLEGLAPRKRTGFARFFSCLGREERARRRTQRPSDYVKVGESCHWTEY
ncbi:hypothetical protein M011DRAFT_413251 [Sporormia fimetaria CBS 119925]|uniref:Uncharacterized protein n=1 Tax=Sporormia fimetaria CBS 119925 TaxID=1340428 RepID=A0A6A6UX84_9PLEO|nr:hypothetical protein M011DRAFT_413251 [Sporormia fimetaria CBS 119925]